VACATVLRRVAKGAGDGVRVVDVSVLDRRCDAEARAERKVVALREHPAEPPTPRCGTVAQAMAIPCAKPDDGIAHDDFDRAANALDRAIGYVEAHAHEDSAVAISSALVTRAATFAWRKGQSGHAVAQLEVALAMPLADQQRAETLTMLAWLHHERGEPAQAYQAWQAAAASATRMRGDVPDSGARFTSLTRARLGIAWSSLEQGRLVGAREALAVLRSSLNQTDLAASDAVDRTHARIDILLLASAIRRAEGALDGALDAAFEACEATRSRSSLPADLAERAATWLAELHIERGAPHHAEALLRSIASVASSTDAAFDVAITRCRAVRMLGDAARAKRECIPKVLQLAKVGRPGLAARAIAEAAETAQQLGDQIASMLWTTAADTLDGLLEQDPGHPRWLRNRARYRGRAAGEARVEAPTTPPSGRRRARSSRRAS